MVTETNPDKKKNDKYFHLTIFVVFGLTIIIRLIAKGSEFIILPIVIALILLNYGLDLPNKIAKNRIFGLSLLVFFDCVLFPLIYLWMLKYDPNCVELRAAIVKNETEERLKDLTTQIDSVKFSNDTLLLQKILSDVSNELERQISYIDEGNIIVLDSFLITASPAIRKGSSAPIYTQQLRMFTANGKMIYNRFPIGKISFRESSFALRRLLQSELTEMRIVGKNAINEKKQILSGRIWNYNNSILYLVNPQEIEPNTKLSTLVHYLHYIVVIVLLWPIVSPLIDSLYKKALKE